MSRKTILEKSSGKILNIVNDTKDGVWKIPDDQQIRDFQLGDEIPSEKIREVSPREFMSRLSPARRTQVVELSMKSATLMVWLLDLVGASVIELDHPDTKKGVAELKSAGVITADEAIALLA